VAWYRVRFKVPADLSGRKLVLHFGAVDEEAWVYLNGELVGEHSAATTGQTVHQIWDQPFDVPLTNARPGAENVLAVRVRDSMMAGGVYKPVRLFVGP
jgi:beta-glucuronidase